MRWDLTGRGFFLNFVGLRCLPGRHMDLAVGAGISSLGIVRGNGDTEDVKALAFFFKYLQNGDSCIDTN